MSALPVNNRRQAMAIQSTGFQFRKILTYFPQDISLAFAYGSGVFRQSGTTHSDVWMTQCVINTLHHIFCTTTSVGHQKNNMLDFVFAVDDPITWHTMNVNQNRSHYSILKFLGPKYITSIQNNYGAGVYYNTLVPCDRKVIKYGVVSTETLVEDLLHWKTLYIAGRLHKPTTQCVINTLHHIYTTTSVGHHKVKILMQKENGRLRTALNTNLKSALNAAFLMLPESFTEEELYLQIAGLSYSGDFRMIIGEDKAKVLNIVKPNIAHFKKLFSNILQECSQAVYKAPAGRVEVDKSPEGQFLQLMGLPKTLQQKITLLVDPPGKNRDVEEMLLQVAHDPDCGNVVQQAINEIVKSSSLTQSAKGILTAGPTKTISYSSKKMYKMIKSLLRKKS